VTTFYTILEDKRKNDDGEIPAAHPKFHRAGIAKVIFKKRHARFSTLVALNKRPVAQEIKLSHVINKIINQDVFGTYAYKGAGAAKKNLSGNRESAANPLANHIDLPAKHGINNAVGLTTRNQAMLKTFAGFGVK
jgi:hypothetical protein